MISGVERFDFDRREECSTPGGIETVISALLAARIERALEVLNARRHRDGDQPPTGAMARDARSTCSTPGGIETVIRRCAASAINRKESAQRPEASRR